MGLVRWLKPGVSTALAALFAATVAAAPPNFQPNPASRTTPPIAQPTISPFAAAAQKASLASSQQGSKSLRLVDDVPLENVPRGRPAPPVSSLALEDLEAIALENNPSLGQAMAL